MLSSQEICYYLLEEANLKEISYRCQMLLGLLRTPGQ